MENGLARGRRRRRKREGGRGGGGGGEGEEMEELKRRPALDGSTRKTGPQEWLKSPHLSGQARCSGACLNPGPSIPGGGRRLRKPLGRPSKMLERAEGHNMLGPEGALSVLPLAAIRH